MRRSTWHATLAKPAYGAAAAALSCAVCRAAKGMREKRCQVDVLQCSLSID